MDVLFGSGVDEKPKLGGLVNRVLGRTLDLKEKEITRHREGCIVKRLWFVLVTDYSLIHLVVSYTTGGARWRSG